LEPKRLKLFDTVKDEHLEALKKMLERLKAEKEKKKYETADFDHSKVQLEWIDVCAAHMYQLLFKEFSRWWTKKYSKGIKVSVFSLSSPKI